MEYAAFQHAFDYYNRELFAGTLPHVYVTVQRKANSRGYFHSQPCQVTASAVPSYSITN